jgi:two-component system, NtrC family, sensor histidine kinase PilS
LDKSLLKSSGSRTRSFIATDEGARRIWRGFLTARIFAACILLLLLLSLWMLGQTVNGVVIALCMAYFAGTWAVRMWLPRGSISSHLDFQWIVTVGIDLLVFSSLLFLQAGGVNFTPLFALPVLLGSVLGTLTVALGTAAIVTLVFLAHAWKLSMHTPGDVAALFLQTSLSSTGMLLVAFLAHQLAARLAREERVSRSSQAAARVQTQVNQMVLETLADGVLVTDTKGVVRAANPAARMMLGDRQATRQAPFDLKDMAAWRPLIDLARMTFDTQNPQSAEIALTHAGTGERRLQVSTRLALGQSDAGEDYQGNLCLFFLEDLREMQARVRTEKLAAMGRMSAAVAHEIRNPLAAISQANALLAEDATQPAQRQLTDLIGQNAQRLARIVDDILDVSRAQTGRDEYVQVAQCEESVDEICHDWAAQHKITTRLIVYRDPTMQHAVFFEIDHLRRVLVNLLDNAARHATARDGAIRVGMEKTDSAVLRLWIWSDGEPLDQGVEKHLFEPFFSSQSRSSGLGLFLCRELCERHGAAIGYLRTERQGREGNEFFVILRLPQVAYAPPALEAQDSFWAQ